MIYNKNARPVQNPHRFGNAWFVDNYKIAPTAMNEIKALNETDPRHTAIIHQEFEDKIEDLSAVKKDTTGGIKLTHYEPNHLKYEYQADSKQLAVFSEVYYPKGWKLFVDGEETELLRANYVLRAAILPEGNHKVEMKFKPKSYYLGNKVSKYTSIFLILFVIGAFGFEGYNNLKRQIQK